MLTYQALKINERRLGVLLLTEPSIALESLVIHL